MESKTASNSASTFAEIYDREELFSILEKLGNEESVPKGTYLYQIGQSKLPDVILLKRGSVKASHITTSGEEYIYNIFRSGSHLFLLASITNEPPALNFITTSQCQAVRIPNAAINDALLSDGCLTRMLLTEFGRKLSFSYKRLRECENYNTEWKICNLLLSLAERSGEEYDGKVLIREKISQQTMASMIRISRITVARTLKTLRDCGLIDTVNGHICIRDEAELLQHMHYISIPLE